ncbi:YbaN family protein [Sulfitobacter mediterraneus]|jgi:uncharacterized protein|uniref:YbaN family protein n=1 Tax=Sulfitobacter mediterraneus TaxID=83219 RepID=UPI0019313DA0|nr:YbaN family protein [Sulfitobacter mediterraneus]MBM1631473.1 YbaN family protein [Sulfitobacter mediterraneus]MBM1639288.1 YbaN family protein [Sulfitobacter mediterraneus]MBM1643337.1 YbaN family protein [Sulfitobacter mediterraneus]MBM1647383.1 YbaN family protein [Sulfitobacter mediterraneus]MBM1651428.1 YbaN family protein [Sulfitobacter mediterraneus]
MTKLIWTACGLIALALGAIGVVLPGLPTTPFIILAAFCFTKGSPRLAAMLDGHHIFGPILEDWRVRGAIAPRFKAIAVVMMALTFAVSLALGLPIVLLVIQAICMSGAAVYVLSRPN